MGRIRENIAAAFEFQLRQAEESFERFLNLIPSRLLNPSNDDESRFVLVPPSEFQANNLIDLGHGRFQAPRVLEDPEIPPSNDSSDSSNDPSPLNSYQMMSIIGVVTGNRRNEINNDNILAYYNEAEGHVRSAFKNFKGRTEVNTNQLRNNLIVSLRQYREAVSNIRTLARFLAGSNERQPIGDPQNLINACNIILRQVDTRLLALDGTENGDSRIGRLNEVEFLRSPAKTNVRKAIGSIRPSPIRSYMDAMGSFGNLKQAAESLVAAFDRYVNNIDPHQSRNQRRIQLEGCADCYNNALENFRSSLEIYPTMDPRENIFGLISSRHEIRALFNDFIRRDSALRNLETTHSSARTYYRKLFRDDFYEQFSSMQQQERQLSRRSRNVIRHRNSAFSALARQISNLNGIIKTPIPRRYTELTQIFESIMSSLGRCGRTAGTYGGFILPALPDVANWGYNSVTGDDLPEETREATNSTLSISLFFGMVWAYAQNGLSVPRALATTAAKMVLAAAGITAIEDPIETGLGYLGVDVPKNGTARSLFNINAALLYFTAEQLIQRYLITTAPRFFASLSFGLVTRTATVRR